MGVAGGLDSCVLGPERPEVLSLENQLGWRELGFCFVASWERMGPGLIPWQAALKLGTMYHQGPGSHSQGAQEPRLLGLEWSWEAQGPACVFSVGERRLGDRSAEPLVGTE